ncbi:MAG: dual specificity protein phosphatase family protein [Bacteroidota bacterium]
MISDVYWINEAASGEKQLGIMARPRGNDWLDDEIKGLMIRSVDCLVSLLETSEAWDLGLEGEAEACQNWGMEFINYPIPDVHPPGEEASFLQLVARLAELVRQGKKVVIHCRMGIGRSSTLAAAVLINLGMPSEQIFEVIGKYRRVKVPDTPAQADWIQSRAERIRDAKWERS